MKKKKYLAIFMAMSMATATAPVTALADDATTGTESGAETGESGSGETGSTGETGSENGGTEGGSTTAPDTPAENEGVKTIDELNAAITAAGETETTIKLAADITGDVVVPEKANITIDLNGKKITNSFGHTIMNNGTLTIKGEGTVDNITHGKAALYNKGTVTLNGGTFDRTQENGKSDSSSGGNSYYTIKNVGNMTINEGVNVLTAEGNGELGRFSSLVGMKRSEKTLGYAASTANASELTVAKSGSLMSGLQGKMAGVQISGGGVTGTSQKVVIRGISSVSSNNPLYIVDGVPINNDRLGDNSVDFGSGAGDINPEDIESVTVLKGASATALYGSRAANGVIMITTKKPQGDKRASITYDGSLTFTD